MKKTTKPPLTKKKLAHVEKAKPQVIKGDVLRPNAAVGDRYVKALTSLVKQMTEQTKRELKRAFSQQDAAKFFSKDGAIAQDADIAAQARIVTNALENKFTQLFGKKAKILASNMISQNDKVSSSTLHASLKSLSGGLSLATTTITPVMKTIISASTTENVSLIKSIPQQYFTQVKGDVMRSITTGNGLQDLIPALEKYEGVTYRRARNIALDQTRKVYSGLNKGRMMALGIKEYEWIHTGGSQHPRQDHIDMDGKIYSYTGENQARDKKTGEPIIPAQMINCHCVARPVIRFDEVDHSEEK